MISATEKSLGEALVSAKLMTAEQLSHAIENVMNKKSSSLIIELIENDFLAFKVFQKFLSQNYNIKTTILSEKNIPTDLIQKISLELIRQSLVMPIMAKEAGAIKKLALAMVNPLDEKAIDAVQRKTGFEVTPILVSLPDFKEALEKYTPQEAPFEHTPIVTYEEQLGGPNINLKFEALVTLLIKKGVITKEELKLIGEENH